MINNYPYTDLHELNLDMILKKIAELMHAFAEFKHINQIIYCGIWNITKNYKPWSVVNDGNFEYMSIQPVPPGIDISNRNYWIVLGYYSAGIAKLFESKENDRVNFIAPADMIYYLDNTDGDDDNDGSAAHPFKTIDGAFEKIAFNMSDIRIYIMHSGTYTCNAVTIGACNMHIHAQVPGVVINFTNEGSFYGVHLNLKGYDSNNKMVITTSNASKTVYMDGGDISGNYIDLQCIFRMNGGYASFQNSTMRNIFCHGAFFIIDDNCTFEDLFTDTAPAIRIKGGFMMTAANLKFNLSQNNNGDFMLIRGGFLDITSQPTNVSGFTYTGASDVNHCELITNEATMTLLKSLAATNTYGPHIVTNMQIFSRVVNTSTNVTSNTETTLGTWTVPAGYARLDICILNQAPVADYSAVVHVTTTDGKVPSTYQTLAGAAGMTGACHIYLEGSRPTSYDVTVAIKEASGNTIKCIIDQMTAV